MDSQVEDAAINAQQALARRGHHRTASPSDLLIAPCANAYGSGVLHYDRDYDLLLEITELDYKSHWLAPAGAL
jgi:predicted nucleic acid-binding protein